MNTPETNDSTAAKVFLLGRNSCYSGNAIGRKIPQKDLVWLHLRSPVFIQGGVAFFLEEVLLCLDQRKNPLFQSFGLPDYSNIPLKTSLAWDRWVAAS